MAEGSSTRMGRREFLGSPAADDLFALRKSRPQSGLWLLPGKFVVD